MQCDERHLSASAGINQIHRNLEESTPCLAPEISPMISIKLYMDYNKASNYSRFVGLETIKSSQDGNHLDILSLSVIHILMH